MFSKQAEGKSQAFLAVRPLSKTHAPVTQQQMRFPLQPLPRGSFDRQESCHRLRQQRAFQVLALLGGEGSEQVGALP